MTMGHPSTKPIDLFLSYSTADKKFCSKLKHSLEMFGATVFLAHKDISPSLEWQNAILKRLESCHVFVPILTETFRKSLWTDQESGIAFASEKPILPVAIDLMPYGLLGRFQAVKGDRDAPYKLARRVFKGLTQQKPLRNRLRETLIQSLKRAPGYDEAGDVTALLAMLSPFSARQLDLLLKVATSNRQVHEARSSVAPLRKIIASNRTRIKPRLLARLRTLTRGAIS
jgi:hypothetical protein